MKTYGEMLEVFGSAVDNARDKNPYAALALTAASELGELYAEIERLRVLTTWQPIETAPKDGSLILGVSANPEGCIDIVGWDSKAGGWSTGYFDREEYYILRDPTHWMPLPKPPKEGKK